MLHSYLCQTATVHNTHLLLWDSPVGSFALENVHIAKPNEGTVRQLAQGIVWDYKVHHHCQPFMRQVHSDVSFSQSACEVSAHTASQHIVAPGFCCLLPLQLPRTHSAICNRPQKDGSLFIPYPHALAPASLAASLGKTHGHCTAADRS